MIPEAGRGISILFSLDPIMSQIGTFEMTHWNNPLRQRVTDISHTRTQRVVTSGLRARSASPTFRLQGVCHALLSAI